MHKIQLIKETDRIPPLYATDGKDAKDIIVHVKLFTPDSNWTWYITEYNPIDRLCFGLVDGFEKELGYFSLDELESIRGPLGLPIERDIYFEPTTLDKFLYKNKKSPGGE